MSGVTYDTTVLVAAERGDRQMWSRHRGLLRLGAVPTVPAPVVAQAWRGGSRQALLARLLAGCAIDAMTEEAARAVGHLLGSAAHDDVVDAAVVESASRRGDSIITADRGHIERLVAACQQNLVIEIV
ncbi:MAG TPA: hypothetical protein VFQ77_07645 [Pseudonocardiaceae bacterium]|jgi:hypothetical protein|nr:hypothetical protein [Pseudonocardiaceae bacterium]